MADTLCAEEGLLLKHRKERKDIQAQIQALKKSAPKGDKKKKREVMVEIAKLEADIGLRHEEELQALRQARNEGAEIKVTDTLSEQVGDMALEASTISQTTRVSKAQKRREKKAAQERDREARAAEDAANLEWSSRCIEEKKLAGLLAERGLEVKEISSDGHCLYNALQHQLELHGIKVRMRGLREDVADYMRCHADDYMCFMSKPDSGDPYTLEDYEAYCTDVATTAAWGGHHEISAVTHIFKVPVKVVQADRPMLTIGEQFDNKPLTLTYHFHAYGLGEHYNSTMPISSVEKQADNEVL